NFAIWGPTRNNYTHESYTPPRPVEGAENVLSRRPQEPPARVPGASLPRSFSIDFSTRLKELRRVSRAHTISWESLRESSGANHPGGGGFSCRKNNGLKDPFLFHWAPPAPGGPPRKWV